MFIQGSFRWNSRYNTSTHTERKKYKVKTRRKPIFPWIIDEYSFGRESDGIFMTYANCFFLSGECRTTQPSFPPSTNALSTFVRLPLLCWKFCRRFYRWSDNTQKIVIYYLSSSLPVMFQLDVISKWYVSTEIPRGSWFLFVRMYMITYWRGFMMSRSVESFA